MAGHKYLRRRKKRKVEGRPSPTFIQTETHEHVEGNAFFLPPENVQAKLSVSQPGDPQELEADRMADKVVHKKADNNQLSRAPEETDKVSKKTKEEEDKISKQGKEEEDKVKKKSKDDEEKKVSKKEKDDEDKLHKKAAPEEEQVSAKEQGATMKGRTPLTKNSIPKRGGESLPPTVQAEMSSSFGYDFSSVRIHKNEEAHQLNEQLQAQAFTHGGDVYFNKDKFNPETEAGKWLLAHELTHVVQQKGTDKIQKRDIATISTPVPRNFRLKRAEGVVVSAQGNVNGVTVIIMADSRGGVSSGSGETSLDINPQLPEPEISTHGRIKRLRGRATVIFTIHTQYDPGANPQQDKSAYGRGTTAADKAAGNTSLRFHEGSHGTHYIAYIRSNPVPAFDGRVGMTVDQYNASVTKFDNAIADYKAAIEAANTQRVECVGKPASFCQP